MSYELGDILKRTNLTKVSPLKLPDYILPVEETRDISNGITLLVFIDLYTGKLDTSVKSGINRLYEKV